ncbi:unnamed protein product, partial [Trichogramma brassicae]
FLGYTKSMVASQHVNYLPRACSRHDRGADTSGSRLVVSAAHAETAEAHQDSRQSSITGRHNDKRRSGDVPRWLGQSGASVQRAQGKFITIHNRPPPTALALKIIRYYIMYKSPFYFRGSADDCASWKNTTVIISSISRDENLSRSIIVATSATDSANFKLRHTLRSRVISNGSGASAAAVCSRYLSTRSRPHIRPHVCASEGWWTISAMILTRHSSSSSSSSSVVQRMHTNSQRRRLRLLVPFPYLSGKMSFKYDLDEILLKTWVTCNSGLMKSFYLSSINTERLSPPRSY